MAAPAAQFVLEPLPWAENALEPYTSAKTISFHYGKHHRAYVDNLNKQIAGTAFAGMPLEALVLEANKSRERGVFNNAAQTWNHTFFWNCMKPGGGGAPHAGSEIGQEIVRQFGDHATFLKTFKVQCPMIRSRA